MSARQLQFLFTFLRASESLPGESSPWREAKTNVRFLTTKFCPLLNSSLTVKNGRAPQDELLQFSFSRGCGGGRWGVWEKTKTLAGNVAGLLKAFHTAGMPSRSGDNGRNGILQFHKPAWEGERLTVNSLQTCSHPIGKVAIIPGQIKQLGT